MGRTIEVLMQDVRYGFRVLRKNPGYALAAILTLALGIGANTAMFSLVYGVFIRPLPYRDGGNLVVLHQQTPLAHVADAGFSPQEFSDYCDHNHTLESMVEHHSMFFLLLGKDSAARVQTSVVSVNFFDVLGVHPLMGRTFQSSDDKPASGAVLVLSYKYWQSRMHGDPNVVGKTFQMNNLVHTVIGVLPPIPQYPVESDVFMPTWQCPFRSDPANIANRNYRLISAVFGRLKKGVGIKEAQADLSVLARQIENAHPDTYSKSDGYALAAAPLQYELTHSARTAFMVLLGVSGFVLLIACANVANMMLARLLKLERELAVRAALGAGRARLLRQLLTESVLLSVTGGLLGLAIAPLALRVLVKFAEGFTTRAAEVRIDAPVLLFTLLVSLGTGLLFGLAPAFSPWHRASALHQGARNTAGRGRQALRGALVVAQVAVSLVLLVGAGLMMRSFVKLQNENPGFTPAHLLTMRLNPSFTLLRSDPQYLSKVVDRTTLKVQNLTGVQSLAFTSNVPFSPTGIANGPNSQNFQIEDRQTPKGEVRPVVNIIGADCNYFETVKQPLMRGRYFNEHDDPSAPLVAIINQTMAAHRWPGEDPIGKRISIDRGQTWKAIIGIVGDTREYGLDHPAVDDLYVPRKQGAFANWIVVRTQTDPERMAPLIRTAIHDIDSRIAVDNSTTVEHMEYESMASPRLMTILLGLFAVLALVISSSGIAAVMALAVSQRTRELGIRMALGAQRESILAMVVKQGLLLAVMGTAVGVIVAVLLTRMISSLLYGTSPTDALTFVAVSALFLAVSAVACLIPARRVTTIDPLVALRQE